MKTSRRRRFALIGAGQLLFLAAGLTGLTPPARADTFTDDFSAGINPANWTVCTNQGLFTTVASNGFVQMSKPVGGSTSVIDYDLLASRLAAQGDFKVTVQYTNLNVALLSGNPGNQMQLDTRFGGQDFLLVRSDEFGLGQNTHVWLSPPANQVYGQSSLANNYGTMQVVRTGAQVAAYLNSNLIYQATFNTNDATFACALQNHGNVDPVTVWFYNFQLTADHLVPLAPEPQIRLTSSATCTVSWADQSWPDVINGYTVLSTPTLNAGMLWQTNTVPGVENGIYNFSTSTTGAADFFRVSQGP